MHTVRSLETNSAFVCIPWPAKWKTDSHISWLWMNGSFCFTQRFRDHFTIAAPHCKFHWGICADVTLQAYNAPLYGMNMLMIPRQTSMPASIIESLPSGRAVCLFVWKGGVVVVVVVAVFKHLSWGICSAALDWPHQMLWNDVNRNFDFVEENMLLCVDLQLVYSFYFEMCGVVKQQSGIPNNETVKTTCYRMFFDVNVAFWPLIRIPSVS